jgi:DNA-binding transcriptional LysR family regulator
MDLLRLRSFVEATRLGSFAAAAEALRYTAPAISQHVAQLEAELGCELLVRGARGVQATPPGLVLFERAERLLADAEVSALAVREVAGQLRTLRIGAFPSAAQHLVTDALARLRAAHPDLVLTLSHFEPPDGLTQLAAGDVDAVVTHRYPGVTWRAPTGVRTTTLATDPLMLMVPADHRLGARKRVDIAQLRDETFISGTPDDPNRIALATACASAGFIPNVAFETADYEPPPRSCATASRSPSCQRLAWPTNARGLSRIALRVEGNTIARVLALAHRVGRLSPLVDEFRRHMVAQPRPG